MDTEKDHIKMCDCEEIQGKWKPKGADFMFNTAVKRVCHIMCDRREKPDYNEDRFLWLPRQDDLQKMLLNPKNTQFDSISTLVRLFGVFEAVNSGKFTSMEQLWLAFVMQEKYQKQWSTDKQKWVKI